MALSDRSKAVLSTILVIFLMLLLILAAEAAVRVRQYLKYGTVSSINSFDRHEATGLRIPTPGMRTASIEINSQGFRGPEIEIPKPEGTVRIGFIGASTTYCAEVSGNDKVWGEMLTRQLNEMFPNLSFDYVNGGVPGYTTGSSLLNLSARVLPLAPDILVVYHASNDLSGETRLLAQEAGAEHTNLATEESWLSRYSLLWLLVEKNLAIMMLEGAPQSELINLNPENLGEEFGRNLETLVDTAGEGGVSLVVLTTFATHLRPGMGPEQESRAMMSARYYMPYMSADSLLAGFARYNEIIREVAHKTGALLVEGEGDIPGTPEYFVDSVHFSDSGSEAQASRILKSLTESEQFAELVGATQSLRADRGTMSGL